MEKLTYRQAFDKITEAYIRGEIEPWNSSFCFCGTLCNNKSNWGIYGGDQRNKNYTKYEFIEMEDALLKAISNGNNGNYSQRHKTGSKEFENALFIGMSNALEVLKEIHRARGEDVDEVPMFTKRELKLS